VREILLERNNIDFSYKVKRERGCYAIYNIYAYTQKKKKDNPSQSRSQLINYTNHDLNHNKS
jgi:hypothetical protein